MLVSALVLGQLPREVLSDGRWWDVAALPPPAGMLKAETHLPLRNSPEQSSCLAPLPGPGGGSLCFTPALCTCICVRPPHTYTKQDIHVGVYVCMYIATYILSVCVGVCVCVNYLNLRLV